MPKPDVRVKRVYDDADPSDGRRVLVDRVWPRGKRREDLALDEWCKAIAPSAQLRKWYGHDPARFAEFRQRYVRELAGGDAAAALEHLRGVAGHGPVTLLTATRELELSQAAVLAELLT